MGQFNSSDPQYLGMNGYILFCRQNCILKNTQDILTSPPSLIHEVYRILMFQWKVDFRIFFYEIRISLQILSGTLFSVQNNRWILIKQKIAEKVNDSDFTEIDLIVPPWPNVFAQTGRHYR